MPNPAFSITPYQKRVEKPWGYELILTPPHAQAVGKLLHINAGFKLSFQYHDQKEETGYLISGQAHLLLEDAQGQLQEINMVPLQGYFIIPFQKHRYVAVTDCEIMEASTPETGNTVRLEDDFNRPTETETLRSQR